jgi:hypothetical protein
MVTIVKEANRSEETCFRVFEWLGITLIAMMNGWQPSPASEESMVFDEEDSKQLCASLEKALPGIGSNLLPLGSLKEPICPRMYLAELTRRKQIEVIDDFLAFCDGKPFRVNVEE